MTSISAFSGWFKKDLISICPRPNAKLLVGNAKLANNIVIISPRLRTFSLPNSLLYFSKSAENPYTYLTVGEFTLKKSHSLVDVTIDYKKDISIISATFR